MQNWSRHVLLGFSLALLSGCASNIDSDMEEAGYREASAQRKQLTTQVFEGVVPRCEDEAAKGEAERRYAAANVERKRIQRVHNPSGSSDPNEGSAWKEMIDTSATFRQAFDALVLDLWKGTIGGGHAEQVFRALWWKQYAHARTTNPLTDDQYLIDYARMYYEATSQASPALGVYQAQVEFGEAYGLTAAQFGGYAALSNYAYTVGQREAFLRYANRALAVAQQALDVDRSRHESMAVMHGKRVDDVAAQELERRQRVEQSNAELRAAGRGDEADNTLAAADVINTHTGAFMAEHRLFPALGILVRQLGDVGRADGVRALGETALKTKLSGNVLNQLAIACASVGEHRLSRDLTAASKEGYEREAAWHQYMIDSTEETLTKSAAYLPAEQRATMRSFVEGFRRMQALIRERSDVQGRLVARLLHWARGKGEVDWGLLVGDCLEAERVNRAHDEVFLARDPQRLADLRRSFAGQKRRTVAAWEGLSQAFAVDFDVRTMQRHYAPMLEPASKLFEATPLIDAVRASGEVDLAVALYALTISVAEKERQGVDVEDRARLFDGLRARNLYRGLIESLLQRGAEGDVERALTVSELTRARQLKDLLGADVASTARLDQPRALPTKLKEALGEKEALVAYHLFPRRLVVMTLTKAGAQAQVIKVEKGAVPAEIAAIRKALADPSKPVPSAEIAALGERLLGPLGELPTTCERLFVLLDGELNTLPLEALPLPSGQRLLEACAVAYLPNMEWVLRQPPEAKAGVPEASKPSLFALADPVYPVFGEQAVADSGLLDVPSAKTRGAAGIPPLPETRDEVLAISKLFDEGRHASLLGEEATESAVKGTDLSGYSHLHFATHGVLAYELPGLGEPALVLADEEGQDAFLTASEAQALKLNAQVTVLSACNTGSGEVLSGEGVLGLGRAFLLAGSKSVVVSLWPVASEATRDLMVAFYEHVDEGLPQAEALRQAKLDILRADASPGGEYRGLTVKKKGAAPAAKSDVGDSKGTHAFFWAPFVIVGGG